MNEKVYIIFKHQDEENDRGEPYDVPTPVRAFASEQDAKQYVKKHDKPYVYREHYGEYYTNHFDYTEVPLNEEDEPMRQPRQLDHSQTVERFNKGDLKNIKQCLVGALYRADNEEEVVSYSRTLAKADYILKADNKED